MVKYAFYELLSVNNFVRLLRLVLPIIVMRCMKQTGSCFSSFLLKVKRLFLTMLKLTIIHQLNTFFVLLFNIMFSDMLFHDCQYVIMFYPRIYETTLLISNLITKHSYKNFHTYYFLLCCLIMSHRISYQN